MKRPEVKNTEAAIRCYYGTGYIGNSDMLEIFGSMSPNTISKLKKAVRAEEIEQNIPEVVPHKVTAKIAYKVWNIDIDQLIENRRQLQALGL